MKIFRNIIVLSLFFVFLFGMSAEVLYSNNGNIFTSTQQSIGSQNPYRSSVPSQYHRDLDTLMIKISNISNKMSYDEYEDFLRIFSRRIDTLKPKYSNNREVLDVLSYIKYESTALLVSKGGSLDDIEDVICELTGECGGLPGNPIVTLSNDFSDIGSRVLHFSEAGEVKTLKLKTPKRFSTGYNGYKPGGMLWLNPYKGIFSSSEEKNWLKNNIDMYISSSESQNGSSLCSDDKNRGYIIYGKGTKSGCKLNENSQYYVHITSKCANCKVILENKIGMVGVQGSQFIPYASYRDNDSFNAGGNRVSQSYIDASTTYSGNWPRYVWPIGNNEILSLEFTPSIFMNNNISFFSDSIRHSLGRDYAMQIATVSDKPGVLEPLTNKTGCWGASHDSDFYGNTSGMKDISIRTSNMIWQKKGIENNEACILELGKKYYINIQARELLNRVELTKKIHKREEIRFSELNLGGNSCSSGKCYTRIRVKAGPWYEPDISRLDEYIGGMPNPISVNPEPNPSLPTTQDPGTGLWKPWNNLFVFDSGISIEKHVPRCVLQDSNEVCQSSRSEVYDTINAGEVWSMRVPFGGISGPSVSRIEVARAEKGESLNAYDVSLSEVPGDFSHNISSACKRIIEGGNPKLNIVDSRYENQIPEGDKSRYCILDAQKMYYFNVRPAVGTPGETRCGTPIDPSFNGNSNPDNSCRFQIMWGFQMDNSITPGGPIEIQRPIEPEPSNPSPNNPSPNPTPNNPEPITDLIDTSGIDFGLCSVNGETKVVYYKSGNMCPWANIDCRNGKYEWGVQFSPPPPAPTRNTIFYDDAESCYNTLDLDMSVKYSKTFLKEEGDSLDITFRGASKDNGQSCLAVIEHPNFPDAANPYLCDDPNNYKDLKDLKSWDYPGGMRWRKELKSNTDVLVSGVKIRAHFRNKATGKMISGKIITVIK